MRKLYSDIEYMNMAIQATEQCKKLVKVQEEIDVSYEVYEYEKKIIEIPVIDPETGEPTGETQEVEVDDLDKPVMVEEVVINPETGEEETILVHKHHTETRKEVIERLEIQDNPENFARSFFETSLGYVRRKAFMKVTGEYKDFLADVAPGLVVGDIILTYSSELQPQPAIVTQQFIDECKQRYNDDFNGVQSIG